ncbi:hypothetical protein [Paraprevotella clara]|uniref:hypothetical protein n=1 Tax=Paraprevotella clara TaxID=454154 RepID=UPI00241DC512|nr:hypothetical protein [Paraprevotella clara]
MQNTCFSRTASPRPSSKVRYRWVDTAIALFNMPIMATTPPTTLYIPKSVTPSVAKTTRLVNSVTAITKNILT